MRLYLKHKDQNVHSETDYETGKRVTHYFYLYCDICGARSPLDYVNSYLEEEWFNNCDLCEDCQKDLYPRRKRSCQQCKKDLKNFKKSVKLHYFDKTFYFCGHNCYYRYVKLKHPKSKKEWDKKFIKLTSEQKKRYRENLKKARAVIVVLREDLKNIVPENKLKHAYAWMRPKC